MNHQQTKKEGKTQKMQRRKPFKNASNEIKMTKKTEFNNKFFPNYSLNAQ